MAAFQLCQLTVNKAITSAITPAKQKIHQLSSVLYAKLCNHLCIAYQAIGVAIRKAIKTHFKNLVFSIIIISAIVAPFTFLKPISLVRFSEKKAARPKRPMQAISIATAEKINMTFPNRLSFYKADHSNHRRRSIQKGYPEPFYSTNSSQNQLKQKSGLYLI